MNKSFYVERLEEALMLRNDKCAQWILVCVHCGTRDRLIVSEVTSPSLGRRIELTSKLCTDGFEYVTDGDSDTEDEKVTCLECSCVMDLDELSMDTLAAIATTPKPRVAAIQGSNPYRNAVEWAAIFRDQFVWRWSLFVAHRVSADTKLTAYSVASWLVAYRGFMECDIKTYVNNGEVVIGTKPTDGETESIRVGKQALTEFMVKVHEELQGR